MNKLIIIFVTFLQLNNLSDGSRILCVFPVPFREHQIIYRPLIDGLAANGHSLVVLTTDPVDKHTLKGDIKQIDLSFTYKLQILDNLKDTTLSGSEMLRTVFSTMREISVAELQSTQIQNLINDENEKFDAIIVEWSTGISMMNGFSFKYKSPLIGISSGGALINSHQSMGNPIHPIAYPNILLPFTDDLNLLQRIASVVFTFWYRYLYFVEELPQQHLLAKQYFGDDLPDLWEIENNADLLLINSYQALGNVRPTVPSTVYLGGMHARKLNRFPHDLKAFLENTPNDLIYINLGVITEKRLDAILYAAKEMKVDIVWNTDVKIKVNTTVRIYNSLDIYQEDILAHPKVKLFITNGGQRNIEDSIHHQVPVLGISHSTYFEHYLRQIEKYQTGIVSLIDFESNEKFTYQVNDVINNEMYKTNVINLKRLLLDEPLTTIDRAIWWIEYAIRNNGTKHIQNLMKNISWFQYLLLDVILTITITVIILVCVLVNIIKRLIKYSKSLPMEMVTRGSKSKIL